MADEQQTEQVEQPQETEQPTEAVVKTEEKENVETTAEEESDVEEGEYVCPIEFNEKDEMRKMFVGGLDKETTDEEFKELFEKYGSIKDFTVIKKDGQKQGDRLFGFITFEQCDDVETCLADRPHKYKERELDVKRAVPKNLPNDVGHYRVKKLHVANIPADLQIKDLKKYLLARHPSKFGKIEEINFVKVKDDEGKLTDKNRGFGFVTVTSEDFADRIAIGESKFILNGHNMRINKAKPRDGSNQGFRGGNQHRGGNYGHDNWSDWGGYGYGSGYGGGYAYGGGYPGAYGYGGGYDNYGGGFGYGGGYAPQKSQRGGRRYNPY